MLDMDKGAYTLEQILEDVEYQEVMRVANTTLRIFQHFESLGLDYITACELTTKLMLKRNES